MIHFVFFSYAASFWAPFYKLDWDFWTLLKYNSCSITPVKLLALL